MGVGVALMGVRRPELVMKSIVLVVMAGVIRIYGLIISHRDQPQGQAILPLRRIRAPHLWPRLRPRRPRRRHVHRHCRRRRCQDVDGQVLQDPRPLRRRRPHHRSATGELLPLLASYW